MKWLHFLSAALVTLAVSSALHSQLKGYVASTSGKLTIQISSPWISKQIDAQGKWSNDKKPSEFLKVTLDSSDLSRQIPVLGAFTVDSKQKRVLYTPRFSLNADTKYRITLTRDSKTEQISIRTPSSKKLETVKIESVYPSANRLPENLLKFYVQFSGPMQRGDIYQYVRLENADGKLIELPFLEIEQELWSRDRKRLTLLLDPGRIKRGLKPREEMGPILESGKKYKFIIDGRWPDATGKRLGKTFSKEFIAIGEDENQPNPKNWKLKKPKTGTRQPLQIEFDESLDHSLLSHFIEVLDAEKKPIDGTVKISNNEKTWTFLPKTEWQPGHYQVSIDHRLEDLVGNSIGRKFDVDQFKKTQPTKKQTTTLPFHLPKDRRFNHPLSLKGQAF